MKPVTLTYIMQAIAAFLIVGAATLMYFTVVTRSHLSPVLLPIQFGCIWFNVWLFGRQAQIRNELSR